LPSRLANNPAAFTVPDGTPVAGYGSVRRRLLFPDVLGLHPHAFWFKPHEGELDAPVARALVLDDGRERLVWVAVDLIAVDRAFVTATRRRLEAAGVGHEGLYQQVDVVQPEERVPTVMVRHAMHTRQPERVGRPEAAGAGAKYRKRDRSLGELVELDRVGETLGVRDLPVHVAHVADGLDDEDVANVLTFVRNSWGNKSDEVASTEVKSARKK
jgi:hypothetical protein